MRPDQLQRLNDLAEKLADRFLVEADPAEWPGDGMPPADLTQQERGDAYWCKKNAMATGGVLRFVLDITGKHQGTAPQENDADMEKRVRDAERRAEQLAARVMNRAEGKREFDKRVHGKG